MVKAKEEYASYVEKYEAVRTNFLEKMESACRLFQGHDRYDLNIQNEFFFFFNF